MKRLVYVFGLWAICATAPAALVTVGPWSPIFKGVDLASGQQQAQLSGERNHQVLCLRVDLSDPDVELFTTPKCTNCGAYETLAENTSRFLEQNRLQAAINGGFYSSSLGPGDPPLGTPVDVLGLAISRGVVVSPTSLPTNYATFLFTTNNQGFYVPTNSPPGTNTTGIYTAIAGNLTLLIRGTNVMAPTPNDLDPRTALGLSADRRYLYLMTIDGRQPGWSDGADFYNTAEWLKRFGAHDGINVDGGGSTTMVMADCQGHPVRLNRSSFVAAYGRERVIGHNFGVFAKPLPSGLKNLSVIPAANTAIITWETDVPATTQVEYGLTVNYGTATPLDTRLLTRHATTLTGLAQGSNYFFRATSTAGGQVWTQACQFTTLRSFSAAQLFDVTKSWIYTTNNLNGVNWKERDYDDSGWMGEGSGLLYALESNAAVTPRNTVLPPYSGTAIPRTYYFRTSFQFAGNATGGSLTFSNYVDDGAVFYLNGTEIRRLRLPAAPTVIVNSTAANGRPCAGTLQAGDAATICPDVFTISGNLLTNLVQGNNVLAVEVHNYVGSGTDFDLVFGCALIANLPYVPRPELYLWTEGLHGTLFWNGEGFTLQQSSDPVSGNWTDVPGPVTRSPFALTTVDSMFYRLRN
jgi:hypothetical protein